MHRFEREYSMYEMLRPGVVRLNLPYFMSESEAELVITAVECIAEKGWMLLRQYLLNPETGEYHHREHPAFRDRKWLGNVDYAGGRRRFRDTVVHDTCPSLPKNFEESLARGKQILAHAEAMGRRFNLPDERAMFQGKAG